MLRTRALPRIQDSLGTVWPDPTDKRAKLGDSEGSKPEVIESQDNMDGTHQQGRGDSDLGSRCFDHRICNTVTVFLDPGSKPSLQVQLLHFFWQASSCHVGSKLERDACYLLVRILRPVATSSRFSSIFIPPRLTRLHPPFEYKRRCQNPRATLLRWHDESSTVMPHQRYVVTTNILL